ncbi:hypothetical protein CALCODRAFT_484788 [Calocera cornea HHB12733]|uniref:Uncharacterized protein n=1 Tax=Calocera cornea HHB12733 TaxID=1353952 RepID=A0A165ES19_9BASI|nr:hypothetical protein CALCODRAFT_484788 [Calocera cornea HHB12733]
MRSSNLLDGANFHLRTIVKTAADTPTTDAMTMMAINVVFAMDVDDEAEPEASALVEGDGVIEGREPAEVIYWYWVLICWLVSEAGAITDERVSEVLVALVLVVLEEEVEDELEEDEDDEEEEEEELEEEEEELELVDDCEFAETLLELWKENQTQTPHKEHMNIHWMRSSTNLN